MVGFPDARRDTPSIARFGMLGGAQAASVQQAWIHGVRRLDEELLQASHVLRGGWPAAAGKARQKSRHADAMVGQHLLVPPNALVVLEHLLPERARRLADVPWLHALTDGDGKHVASSQRAHVAVCAPERAHVLVGDRAARSATVRWDASRTKDGKDGCGVGSSHEGRIASVFAPSYAHRTRTCCSFAGRRSQPPAL